MSNSTKAETPASAASAPTAGQVRTAAAQAPDPDSPVARLQRAARRAKAEGDPAQAEKFAQAARNLGADQDDAFVGILKALAPARRG